MKPTSQAAVLFVRGDGKMNELTISLDPRRKTPLYEQIYGLLLYPLGVLTERLHAKGLEIFLETSGTHPFSGCFDWVCLSPKRQQPPLDEAFGKAHELKVIVGDEADFEWAERNAARVGAGCILYLQPEWSVAERMMPAIVEYAKAHPKWNISIQTHKYMHIP